MSQKPLSQRLNELQRKAEQASNRTSNLLAPADATREELSEAATELTELTARLTTLEEEFDSLTEELEDLRDRVEQREGADNTHGLFRDLEAIIGLAADEIGAREGEEIGETVISHVEELERAESRIDEWIRENPQYD